MSGTIVMRIDGRNENNVKAPKNPSALKLFRDVTDCGRQYRETLAEKRTYVRGYITKACGSGGIL